MPLGWIRELSSQPPPLSSVEFQLSFYQMPSWYSLDTVSVRYAFLIIPTLTSSPFSEGPSWAVGISVHFSYFLYCKSSDFHLRSQQWLIPKTLADISVRRPVLLMHLEGCSHSFSLSVGLPCEAEESCLRSRLSKLASFFVQLQDLDKPLLSKNVPTLLLLPWNVLSREPDLWLPSESDHVYTNTTGRH